MKNISSPWNRLLATVIDNLINLSLGLAIFSQVVGSSDMKVILDNLLYLMVFLIFGTLVIGLVNITLTSIYGGSIGKILIGLMVVDSENKKISFWKAVFRNYIGYFVSGALVWLGFLWAFKDKEHQAWHDMLVDTHVVNVRDSGLVTGFLTLIGLVGLCGYLIFLIFGNILINIPLYTEIYTDIKTELIPTPTPKSLFRNSLGTDKFY